uniref:Rab-GAP TBC domain-containing protein n=1 Tax=Denticeps clupeoides TaxID=299321 RepID=A0AAY4BWI2_9TELE
GFKTLPEEEDEEEKIVAMVLSVGVKWENFLASTMNREMVPCPELKSLVRSGVPHVHRSKVWRYCVAFHVRKYRDCLADDYYKGLLSLAREKQNPASKQIELDLLRTLPNNKHYSSPSSDGIQKLRNVLLAFSWRNPDIGYCQGLNRYSIALLYLEEEDAFWCLTAIVEVFMPRDYYTKTLLGSQVDQRVFKDLMSEKLPRLHNHFEQYKVDFSLITFNWFLVVFVDSVTHLISLPVCSQSFLLGSKVLGFSSMTITCAIIQDDVSSFLLFLRSCHIRYGDCRAHCCFVSRLLQIIFRFALALFKCKEEEFLKLQDSMAIFKYLRYFTQTVLDVRYT